jgi:hypothetical protein
MTAQENIQLLRDLFRAMDTPGAESEEAMMNMLDENIAWHAMPCPGIERSRVATR